MTAYEVIHRKRGGGELSRGEIAFMVDGYLADRVADYQMAAFLMAVYFRGMSDSETEDLTRVMLESGISLDLSALDGPKIDKHSTGGVGDKLSLIVAPVAAAAGVLVPMISGRGLGHTGGTLDKLESIPGMRTDFAPAEFERLVGDVGMAIVGQSPKMAPADRRMYALRDVTATIECVPLIVGSILSKKLAAGLDALVLDVKVGRGAFMSDIDDARGLARSLLSTAGRLGLPASAVLTDMESPIGLAIGNALEVAESIEVLKGGGPADVRETSVELSARMLLLGGSAETPEEARDLAESTLDSGKALAVFSRFVEAQRGDPRVVDDPGLLPDAPVRREAVADSAGFVAAIDALEVGLASAGLGAGRATVGDDVDPSVGVVISAPLGAEVAPGQPLAVIHAASEADAERAAARVASAFRVEPSPAPAGGRVLDVLE